MRIVGNRNMSFAVKDSEEGFEIDHDIILSLSQDCLQIITIHFLSYPILVIPCLITIISYSKLSLS